MFDSKNLRVLRIHKLLSDPDLFKYIEAYFDSQIRYEDAQLEVILNKSHMINDLQRDSLNLHNIKRRVLKEIKFGFKESLISYMKMDDSEITDLDGAKYQETES